MMTSTRETDSAAPGLMMPEGTGLPRVRSILASIARSWYWLSADAPQARRKTAAAGMKTPAAR